MGIETSYGVFVSRQFNYTKGTASMPFILPALLSFQGSTHLFGVGSFSKLIKFHGEPVWGTTVFEEGSLCAERRAFRTARRRLDRKKQRVKIIQELFAEKIAEVDPRFFIRLQESRLYREEGREQYILFNDAEFKDSDYHKLYPTIHHLIVELCKSEKEHDVRLVYLACAWLVSHRGHFLSNINAENLTKIKDLKTSYESLMDFFSENGYAFPWNDPDVNALGEALKKKNGVTNKQKDLIAILYNGKKPGKEIDEDFPYSRDAIVRLLAGGTCKLKDLFGNEEYELLGSISLAMEEEKFTQVLGELGNDGELLTALRGVSDWAVLADVLGNYDSISEAKVAEYEQHKEDLALLKYFIRKYTPDKYYSMFRDYAVKANYVAYSYHTNGGNTSGIKKVNKADFLKYVQGIVKSIKPTEEDSERFMQMLERVSSGDFMPKQRNTDNRVIPHQLYLQELKVLLKKASCYLPFLEDKDSNGLSVSEKIISTFMFRIPYFVGPLNTHSQYNWLERKQGKIYPWNFEEMVDLDKSEEAFINKLTNHCSYLPDETVLPKDSLLYHKFMVLNEINNLRINGEKITVQLKQNIYNELFMNVKKVTRKKLENYLISNGILEKDNIELLTGIDDEIKSDLSPQIAFKKLMESGLLSEDDVERIIERASYADDKQRLQKWLNVHYGFLDDADKKYICRLKIKDFGRLSKKFLTGFEGTNNETGEILTIIGALWDSQDNLMEILSKKYTFKEQLEQYTKEYYSEHPLSLSDRLDEMYVSNAVKRPIYRTVAIMNDVVKALGIPKKIFIETTRGADPSRKGQRTKSRKQQILDLYEKCKSEDVRLLKQQLEEMGEYADSKLQGDKLFLYYMQLGKSMYSGKAIELSKLGTKQYDIDHIYPQAYVKDDSIINNKVLVLSEENGKKQDIYPVAGEIRSTMHGFWNYLRDNSLISEEKYKRLTRSTPFSAEEKMGFISRQLTETSQATKAVATILSERYPDTKIVYCKARLVSDFRQEFDLVKCRSFNDLHHAVDAYLNIVTGNVYDMKFMHSWFNTNSNYSIKTKTLFTRPLICSGKTVWDGEPMLSLVKKTAVKNTAHFTKYAFFKQGGLFDQNPVSASEGLIPLKKDLPTDKYGGYNKAGIMFFIPVRYKQGKKTEVIIMSVEIMHGKRFLEDDSFAREYSYDRLRRILGKEVDSVEFPMGMRPWKINTVLSLDGFKICIAGAAGGGKCLIAQPIMQFSESRKWQNYIKRIERFVEKMSQNQNYVYDKEYDKVCYDQNVELYDLYLDKCENSIFRKRVNPPTSIIKDGRETFLLLDVKQQAQALLNIHATFGRVSGGCDLKLIGGGPRASATVNFSSTISNWKKYYTEVRVIDSSVTGIWEKQSENLLDLL